MGEWQGPPGAPSRPRPSSHSPFPILHLTRQRLKDLAQLSRRRARRRQGVFLVEGLRSVEAAVAAGAALDEIVVAEGAEADPRLAALVASASAPVSTVPARDLNRVADAQTSQGVVAVARSVVADDAGGLTEAGGPVLLLDGVQDPGNVGALVRTAAWFGVAAVVADERSADFETPKAVRASMGGIWDVALVRVPSLAPVLDGLAEAGVEAWGADLGGTPVGAWAPGRGAALVMGSEGHGLSDAVAERLRASGGFVHIPGPAGGARGVESLNVVVAGGVLLARWLGA